MELHHKPLPKRRGPNYERVTEMTTPLGGEERLNSDEPFDLANDDTEY
jgi:hypothetical protein